jgi:2-keto-4-pentenoate hydratase
MRPSVVPSRGAVYAACVTDSRSGWTAEVAAIERLEEAAAQLVPCAPVRDLLGTADIGAAYRVQSAIVAHREATGRTRIGRKIGLTSAAVQTQLGVDRPDFGVLLDDMAVPSGGIVPGQRLLQPRVEGEVAFRLQHDLDGELTAETVRTAVSEAFAAIEIVDSRVANWDISIVDTISDNASSGMFVVSEKGVPLSDIEPRDVTMQLYRNEQPESSGMGRACLGDPLEALLWLARTAREFGDPLRAGEVVLSGALGPLVTVQPGDAVRVEISGLGAVSVSFSGDQQ